MCKKKNVCGRVKSCRSEQVEQLNEIKDLKMASVGETQSLLKQHAENQHQQLLLEHQLYQVSKLD